MTVPSGPGHIARSVVGALLATSLDALLIAAGLGGFAALFGHTRALALLGGWAIGAVVLALLHPVRKLETSEREQGQAAMMIALFLLPLATPPLSALGERLALWPLPGGATLGWSGVALSAGGFALRIAAMARLGSRFSPYVEVQQGQTLETRGLYAWVRHPGYLGAWLASLGAAMAFGSALGLAPVLVFGVLLAWRAGREDAMLERHFGESFREYRARTGGILPRLVGRG